MKPQVNGLAPALHSTAVQCTQSMPTTSKSHATECAEAASSPISIAPVSGQDLAKLNSLGPFPTVWEDPHPVNYIRNGNNVTQSDVMSVGQPGVTWGQYGFGQGPIGVGIVLAGANV